MNREEAVQLVRGLEAAANARDTSRIMQFYADDAVLVSPVWGRLLGRDEIARTWEETFARFTDWTVKVDDLLLDGDRVIFLGRAAATDRHGWFGEAPTGEWFEYKSAIALTVRHGKIVHDERVYDLTSLLQRFEKQRLDQELRMAADVQRVLLSKRTHRMPFCEATGDSIPCRAIGGDFFEFAPLPTGHLGIALGDVAGKGPAAALLASMIQGMLAIEIAAGSGPSATLTRLNRVLVCRGLEPRYVTLVYAVLSPDGEFVYSNGGHNPPLLLTVDGVRQLAIGGPVVGAFEGSSYEEQVVQLRTGDSLVLYSDGVTEARDQSGEEFGEERLIAIANRASTAAETQLSILRKVHEFCRGATQADDITVAVVKFGA